MSSATPVVAVIGRPNVGKSTLVNRILGKREAIVQEMPGVTRDRIVHEAEWTGHPFLLVDTGGLELSPHGELARKVAGAARSAAEGADVLLLVVDATTGPTSEDRDVAAWARKTGRRIVLVANKADNASREALAAGFFELGVGEPHAVSALHGRGTADLLDEVTRGFELSRDTESSEHPAIAVVGRPNVGKSSLFNLLIGRERSIVHDEPGTTRDTVDTVMSAGDRTWRFVDTAGMRRQANVDDGTEYYSFVRTMRALDRCEIALLVIDAAEGLTRQDLRIAEQIRDLGRSAVLVLNKIDLLEPVLRKQEREQIRRRMPYLEWAPLVETSARTRSGIDKILPVLSRVMDARPGRIPTPHLNALIEDIQARTPAPGGARVKYAVQAGTSPPVVVLFGSGRLRERWLRFLERRLRATFGFEGTPIHFSLKGPAPRRGAGAQHDGGDPRSRHRRRR